MSRLTVRLPDTLHRQLSTMAQDEGISLNQYIVYALTRQVTLAYTVRPVPATEIAEQRASYTALLQNLGQATFEEIVAVSAAESVIEFLESAQFDMVEVGGFVIGPPPAPGGAGSARQSPGGGGSPVTPRIYRSMEEHISRPENLTLSVDVANMGRGLKKITVRARYTGAAGPGSRGEYVLETMIGIDVDGYSQVQGAPR